LPIFFLLFSFNGNAQNLIIQGQANDFIGKEITISTIGDYVTGGLEEKGNTLVDNSGLFKFPINIGTTSEVVFKVDDNLGYILIEPNRTYNLIIERNESGSATLIIDIEESKKGELNFDINSFDSDFSELTASNYNLISKGKKKKQLDTLFENFGNKYKKNGALYLNTYIDYKIAMIKMMTHKSNIGVLENEFLVDKPVEESNGAYMNFINQYFANFLLMKSLSPEGEKLIAIVNEKKDYNEIMEFLGKENVLENIQLRELVLLKGLYEVYRDPLYIKQMVVDMLDTIKVKTQFSLHKILASNIKSSITKLDKGSVAPNFQLKNAFGTMQKLSDFKGKYVYLDFWATWCMPCLQEMKVLPGLIEKYGQKVTFISISVDKDFEKMRSFLEKNKKLDNANNHSEVFLFGGDSKQVKADYNIRSIPSYFLIDKEGKFVKSPAERPSGNIEKTFNNLFQINVDEPDIVDPGN